MLSLAFSAAMLGIEGYVVRVEADSSAGTPAFAIIGLPDRALREAGDRVRAAIFNSGLSFPAGRLLVNLSPADVRKAGPAFDLAIALALIGIDEQIDRDALRSVVALGELALDGSLQSVNGILPMVLGARAAGFRKLILPAANSAEALMVDGIHVYAVERLLDAVAVIAGDGSKWRQSRLPADESSERAPSDGDFYDVRGQSGGQGNRQPAVMLRAKLAVFTKGSPEAVGPVEPLRFVPLTPCSLRERD
jgi:magnesium chelatase family protein